MKDNYLYIETLKRLSGLLSGSLERGDVGHEDQRDPERASRKREAWKFELTSAAITSTSGDALEAKAQQIASRIEGYV